MCECFGLYVTLCSQVLQLIFEYLIFAAVVVQPAKKYYFSGRCLE